MKIEIEADEETVRKLDALCEHWSKVRAADNAQFNRSGADAVPPMTRELWLELHVDLAYDRDIGK